MKVEHSIANEYVVNASEVGKVIIHSLYGCHCLTIVDHEQGIVLKRFGIDLNAWVVLNLVKPIGIGRHELALGRHNLQLRIEGREEVCHCVLKSVEDGEYAHQCCGGNSDTTHGHARNDVDGVVRLLGEKVTGCYVEGEIFHLFTQQAVDVIDIVERVVDEELQLRDDAKLMALKVAEFVANL